MDILPRQLLPILVSGLVLVCILLGLLVAQPAQADVGVQPILPDGSNIQPEGETPIQMAAEKVVFYVRQATAWDSAAVKFNPEAYEINPHVPIWNLSVAMVTAVFTMTNPTRQAASMMVWFPLASSLETDEWENHIGEVAPRIESFQVAVDGKPLAYRVSELPNPRGEDLPLLPWASFPVTFPARDEAAIQVSYVLWAKPDISRVGMKLYYIFQTGAGWAGPIGKAELLVNLPYPASAETIGAMPEGGQIEGYQARWTWKNLEPGPQDDFSIWLVSQERWEELEPAKIAVKDEPENGEAWLKLASTYESLWETITERGHIHPGLSTTYQQLGVEAAKEAARLLPEDVTPHYLLAMFYSAGLEQNPPPEALQPVWDEMKAMKELDPELAQGLEPNVYDVLEWVLYNDATATAEAIHWAADNATETAKATLYNDATATAEAISWACWATANAECTATPTPSPPATPKPSATPQPLPSTPPTPIETTGNGQRLVISVAAGVMGLVVVGYLVLKRNRGRASNK